MITLDKKQLNDDFFFTEKTDCTKPFSLLYDAYG